MRGRLLIVVRHGRTQWNASGRFQGRADPPLDEVGAEQASDCAKALVAEFARADLGSPRILSSDLRRAADTAAAIAGVFGEAFEQDPMLREVDVGRWEGLTRPQAEALFPDEYRRWEAGCDIRRGGGETLDEAGRRVADRVEPELGRDRRQALVVVGHGMALQAGLRQLRARGCVIFDGDAPHLGNGQWLAVAPPGGGPPPLG